MTGAGVFSHLDPRSIGAGLAMLATAAALIGWQHRGDPARARAWLGYGALFVELLAASMAVAWAFRQGTGMLTLFFGLGFIGLAVSKATTAGVLVHNWRNGNTGGATAGLITLIGVYAVVYLAGSFEGTLHTAETTANAAGQSAPIQAIDAQLANAREQLAGLAPYADPAKADNEAAQLANAEQARASQIRQLEEQISQALASPVVNSKGHTAGTLSAMAGDCFGGGWYVTEYCAPVTSARRELAELKRGTNTGASYGPRHDEYVGVRAHVASLEQQRAELLSTGGAAQAQAAGADDRLIGWAFGLGTVEAAGLKWLLFVLGFDLLGLGLRVTSEMQGGGVAEQVRRRLNAMLSAGIDPATAAGLVSQDTPANVPKTPTAPTIPPAGVILPDAIPALYTGGLITSDGLAVLHAGERVLTVAETEEYHAWKANKGTPSKAAPKDIGAPNTAMPNTAMPNTAMPNTAMPNTAMPKDLGAPIGMPKTVYRDRERVPPELSQQQGRGRVGKVDACRDCGADFLVEIHNGTRCKPCTERAQSSFKRWQARKPA